MLAAIEFLYFKMVVKNGTSEPEKRIYYNKNKFDSFLLLTNIINIASRIITTKIYLLLRVALLFDPFLSLTLPQLIEENRVFNKKTKFAIKFVVYLVLLLNMYVLLRSNGSGVMPYKLADF